MQNPVYVVLAGAPRIETDVYFASPQRERALVVLHRLQLNECVDAGLRETTLPSLPGRPAAPRAPYRYDMARNELSSLEGAAAAPQGGSTSAAALQLERFYPEGARANAALSVPFEQFERDAEITGDFGQGASDVIYALMLEYRERTGRTCSSFEVLDRMDDIFAPPQPSDDQAADEHEQDQQEEDEEEKEEEEGDVTENARSEQLV